ncbi:MAG: hypothetical protein KGH84_01045 [Paracoccaceae bacterium]|nr:hypothetical protein [Paracoccaceae bacterium]
MQILKLVTALALVGSLAGCLENNTQRGVAGAAGGALVAGALGGDMVAGAVVGGVAGAVCHDLRVPGCRNDGHGQYRMYH